MMEEVPEAVTAEQSVSLGPVVIAGDITALSVDSLDRYCILVEGTHTLRKIDLRRQCEVRNKEGVELQCGGILTSNGEYWAMHRRNGRLVIFDKYLKIVKIIPQLKEGDEEQDGDHGNISPWHRTLDRSLIKFHRHVLYFNPKKQKLYKITRQTNKIIQVIDFKKLEGNKEFSNFREGSSLKVDQVGKYAVLRGAPTNEDNLMIYDMFARKLLCGPAHIPDTYANMGTWSAINKSTLQCCFFYPENPNPTASSPRPLLAVGGVYPRRTNLPFVQLCTFDHPNIITPVVELTIPTLLYYTPVSIYQRDNHLHVILSNKLLVLACTLFPHPTLTIEQEVELIATSAFADISVDGQNIWTVEKMDNSIKKIRIQ